MLHFKYPQWTPPQSFENRRATGSLQTSASSRHPRRTQSTRTQATTGPKKQKKNKKKNQHSGETQQKGTLTNRDSSRAPCMPKIDSAFQQQLACTDSCVLNAALGCTDVRLSVYPKAAERTPASQSIACAEQCSPQAAHNKANCSRARRALP